jgi:hypothetical protein
MTVPTATPLPNGTVVDYRGSLTHEHGEKVVIGYRTSGYVLRDRDYPHEQFELRRVRRASIVPTGAVLVITDPGRYGSLDPDWGRALYLGDVAEANEQIPLFI